MNEITVLMHLLTRKINNFHFGATKDEIIKSLNFSGKNETVYFQKLITQLSRYIEPLGLQIRFNPLSSHWYITFDIFSSDFISANPFEDKPRLAATLFCTLICCLKSLGSAKIQDIKVLRKKKHVIEDLKELMKMGYLELDEKLEKVNLTPLIGYHLDINKLFINLILKLKRQNN
ncbi:MAG: hypothetical protein ACXAEX_06655 [Promethearchaeota archaeon]|jgi:hypothetical protein